ncbi:hypothetical protein LCGC14_0609850 [marine sediment metagenome]|uniref:Uncharacterized protein n=1 Tax=marine sediment metagenome TaxID=412755 RepID=A0A0F9RCQ2_9ZZZZ
MRNYLTGPMLDADGGGGGEAGATLETALEATGASPDGTGSPDPGEGADASPIQTSPGEAGEETTEPITTIPLERHESVLANARRDHDDLRAATGWADGMDREQVATDASNREWLARDPEGYIRYLQSQRSGGDEPQPDRQTQNGELFYTPEQAAKLADHRLRAGISASETRSEARFKPLEEAGAREEARQSANHDLTEASNWPKFTENMNEIAGVMQVVQDRGEHIDLVRAYLSVVVPKLTATDDQRRKGIRAEILAEMAGGGSNDNDPSRSASSPSRKPDSEKSLQESLEEAMAGVTQ